MGNGNRKNLFRSRSGAVEFVNDFNQTDDVAVELFQFFGRNPILPMFAGTCGLDGKLCKVFGLNLKSKNGTRPAIASVPVACNLNGVVLTENRVEDRLLGEARRKSPPAAGAN